jgi:hypothetical protein
MALPEPLIKLPEANTAAGMAVLIPWELMVDPKPDLTHVPDESFVICIQNIWFPTCDGISRD